MAEDEGRDAAAPRKWVRRRASAHYSPNLAARICERVAAGELLYRVLRDNGMPTPQSVGRWARERADFAAALAAARKACGRTRQGGGVWTLCEGTAQEVFERVCEGESLTSIGEDPTMPSLSTLFNWRRSFPDFDAEVRLAMRVRAELIADRGDALADAATPETAYLTHVRLSHLRWRVGVLAPWEYRLKMAEPPAPAKRQTRLLLRKFEVEIDAETGRRKVVAYCPNPDTGEVEREDMPGWRQAPDSVSLPGGRPG